MEQLEQVRREYLSVTETAKLIRQALKKEFPGVKFSVRSDSYSGGASIRVGWTDGPTDDQVSSVTNCYRGGGFDGMIDMAYSVQSWLMPDGSAHLAHDPGTGGQRGSIPEVICSPPHPDARQVHFMADYVFTNRDFSEEWLTEIESQLQAPGILGDRSDGQCKYCGNWMRPGCDCFIGTGRYGIEFACSLRCAASITARFVSRGGEANG